MPLDGYIEKPNGNEVATIMRGDTFMVDAAASGGDTAVLVDNGSSFQ